MTRGRVLVVLGTASSVGKSLLVTALCRILARWGYRVAPFKAQNMSNNAAVCPDGAEIGRAQYLQALAAGVEPCADMNPVLLKPEADARCQVVVHGRVWKTLSTAAYSAHRKELWRVVVESLDRLRTRFALIIVEGAGSPVELNLRAGDLVNMRIARYARAPVLLVADIDRGGVFAQVMGTLWLLPVKERQLVRGIVINKFRGDPRIFDGGRRLLEQKSRRPVLGVIPFVSDLCLPEEDAAPLDDYRSWNDRTPEVDIAVIRFPHIANFDDFDPLRREPGVRVRWVHTTREVGHPHAVVLPGTKSTMADLAWLRGQGFDSVIRDLANRGTCVVGICGGYQMLGRCIRDPAGVESSHTTMPGLGLLPVETVFADVKATHQVRARIVRGLGWLTPLVGAELQGYEIHMGQTLSPEPWLVITRQDGPDVEVADGAIRDDARVWGCYLHGLFSNDGFRRLWLRTLGWSKADAPISPWEAEIDRWADIVESHLAVELILRWLEE